MSAELRSTTRPSTLRLIGFLAVVLGAALVGVAATREWVTIGFTADVKHVADVSVHGTDVWEGKALLLAAAGCLVLLLAMRIARSPVTRRAIAITIVVVGLGSTVLAIVTAVRAPDRFGGSNAVDRLAETIARQTGDAVDVVRAALEQTLNAEVRTDVGPTLWLAAAGGVVLAIGGALSIAWVREGERSSDVAELAASEPGSEI